jgi:hypothetical protein
MISFCSFAIALLSVLIWSTQVGITMLIINGCLKIERTGNSLVKCIGPVRVMRDLCNLNVLFRLNNWKQLKCQCMHDGRT